MVEVYIGVAEVLEHLVGETELLDSLHWHDNAHCLAVVFHSLHYNTNAVL